jgi:hypothetical protein
MIAQDTATDAGNTRPAGFVLRDPAYPRVRRGSVAAGRAEAGGGPNGQPSAERRNTARGGANGRHLYNYAELQTGLVSVGWIFGT